MIENNRALAIFAHIILVLGVATIAFPLYYAFVGASLPIEEVLQVPMPLVPGDRLIENMAAAWDKGSFGRQLVNSAIMASVIAGGKIAISLLSAFAITYFRFPFRTAAFWAIFVTLMLPIEVRIVPTYEVAANALAPLAWLLQVTGIDGLLGGRLTANLQWSLLDSYVGLTLPLIASATATFLFRQFYLTIPDDLAEAAKIDGAGPMRFFRDVVLPLSTTNIAALAVILFVFGWNQYLWPLLITTDPSMTTVVVGVARLIPGPEPQPAWNVAMAGGLVALLPPVLVVLVMQHWFVKGLVDTEK
ncbi:sn-glycerol-3-phosphate transport system permease protein UgpE [Allostella sp. ATCC 35155]|nr:sn-glycerol-3-phosphate transport system permease protein UgpE [Stella sp. ATCC 35155]